MGKQAISSHEKLVGYRKNVQAVTNSDSATISLLVEATKQSEIGVTGKSVSTVSKLSASSHSLQTATLKLQQTFVSACGCAGCACGNNVVFENDTASLIHAVS